MEWFDKIYQWIMENLAVITAWFGAGELSAIGVIAALLVRNMRASKYGSYMADKLNSSLLENNQFAKKVKTITDDMSSKIQSVCDNVNIVCEKLELFYNEFHATTDLLNSKIGAMMEVQALVYSTVKDEDLRNSITKILTSAKYNDQGVQTEIASEIAKMQEEFSKALSDMQKTLASTVQNVNEVNKIPGSVNSTNNIKRY